jgi:branched-chain amino acid transport system permease protein
MPKLPVLAWVSEPLKVALGPALVLLVLAFMLTGTPSTFEEAGVRGLVFLIGVLGLYTFMGNSGVVSFGHVSFIAVGAYAGSLVSIPPVLKEVQLPALPQIVADAELAPAIAPLIGGLAALCLACLIAPPIVRLAGLAAGVASFSILVIVFVVAGHWEGVTHGTLGLSGVPSGVETPMDVLPWAIAALLAASFFQSSRFGRRLRGSREDEAAARSLGIRVGRERGLAFLLSAAISGVAGALYAQYLGTFGPGSFYLDLTFTLIAMLIIGGMTSLWGAVLGVVAVTGLTVGLQEAQEGVSLGIVEIPAIAYLSNIGVALAMLIVLVVRPDGLAGGRELAAGGSPLRRLARRRARPEDSDSAPDAGSEDVAGAARRGAQ